MSSAARSRTSWASRAGVVGPFGGLVLVAAVSSSAATAFADESVPPPAPMAPLAPGVRLVSGQAAIVAGNTAGARERALDEAMRQAVDQALAEQLDAQTRATQARAIKTLEGRARTFIKRYRTVDENESNGLYTIRIEAEVDDAALGHATERWTVPPLAPGVPPAHASAAMMVVVSGPADAGAALMQALAANGIRAQLGDPSLSDPTRAVQAAGRAALPMVAFVSATVADEGIVRGVGQSAVSCQMGARVLSVPSGQSVVEATASPRAFAERPPAARADCFSRAAAAVAPRLSPSGTGPASAPSDLRVLVLDLDVVEPSAIGTFLKTVRGLGSVSSAEVRRILLGRAEIRVRTRLAAPALAAALSRDVNGPIMVSDVQTTGDLVRLRVRLRPPAAPVASP